MAKGRDLSTPGLYYSPKVYLSYNFSIKSLYHNKYLHLS